jgi:D-alanyl-lipoteichoic acid acyltransferase DltB (MBOAT superfamily)
LLGFHFNINFDSPYKSATITEFWRRWHISLSTWLRDYLYISLGGNRKGKIRTHINLIITMLIGGLWHGASLRFICWGALHGIALAAHKLAMNTFPFLKADGNKMKRTSRIFGILFTFHLVCFGWLFFRANSFQSALEMMRQITTSFHPELFLQLVQAYPLTFALMGSGFILHFTPKTWENTCLRSTTAMPLFLKATVLVAVIILVMQIKSSDIQPFIYFQF